MSEGLVAPSWSDSGDVPVGEVTEFAPITLSFKGAAADYPTVGIVTSEPCRWDLRDKTLADCAAKFDRQIHQPTLTVNITNTKEWKSREEWESILRAWVRKEIVPQVKEMVAGPVGKVFAKPSDPNAKPAMSALSKVAGESYRGLGWCDE